MTNNFIDLNRSFAPIDKDHNIPLEWDLRKLGLVENNPLYDKEFSEKNHRWGMDLILECYRLKKLEKIKN